MFYVIFYICTSCTILFIINKLATSRRLVVQGPTHLRALGQREGDERQLFTYALMGAYGTLFYHKVVV